MERLETTYIRPQTIYRENYTPPTHQVESIDLTFELGEEQTRVTSRLHMKRRGDSDHLRLDGQQMAIVSVSLDGRTLTDEEYALDDEGMELFALPAQFELEIVTVVNPSANTALEGLYLSGGNFCTQCEAEGFRNITYFPDRPDVMTAFTTRIEADKQRYPVLLSNGDCIERGDLDDGRHYAVWRDPFLKPCYLFALVAGDLACIEDHFTTHSGRDVTLQIYVQHGNEDKTEHAMRSLKKSMRWDEETYGREYDLDTFMIVAVDDFNMGAMENKGLNIFNSRFVLARPDTATDMDYINIEGVIGHEYFHNWSGNRVTCRDWFQLSLKEGFTVFRDQQFTADMNSAAIKRIDDVSMLRTHQFAEDAGPMAHPIRPDSYQEINNFYTLTVYEKGAEVVRMLHTLLGSEAFRKGADRYFERHDGQAVTCDDFVQAMEDANGVDLARFRRWYGQAGTPQLSVVRHYDAAHRRYTLTFTQQTAPTPGQAEKLPLPIPVRLSLLGRDGRELLEEQVVVVDEAEQSFSFEDIGEEPIPSLLRNFSAPVRLQMDWQDQELAYLMAHETDAFNRWEASQQLGMRVIQRLLSRDQRTWVLEDDLSNAFASLLNDVETDPALISEAMTLPAVDYIAETMRPADPVLIWEARQFLRKALGRRFATELLQRYHALNDCSSFDISAEAMAERRLKNSCLHYLLAAGNDDGIDLAFSQAEKATNMTDLMAALTGLLHNAISGYELPLQQFYDTYRDDTLVLDKWFALQASNPAEGALERVQALMEHADFSWSNPNRFRSVVASFAMRNPAGFHRDMAAYRFLAEQIKELDKRNPQVAARMIGPLSRWKAHVPEQAEAMRQALVWMTQGEPLSRDVNEVVSKSLADD